MVLALDAASLSGEQREVVESEGKGLRLVEATDEYVIVELLVPELKLDELELGGQWYVAPLAAGLDESSEPGAPRLPRTGTLIGLPPTGAFSVRVLEKEGQTIRLSRPVAPSPVVLEVYGTEPALGSPAPPKRNLIWAPNEIIYGADASYPAALVTQGETTVLRDLRVARLMLNPVRYNPVRAELEHVRRLVVEVRFEAPILPKPDVPGVWGSILGQGILNYDVARGWRMPRPVSSALDHESDSVRNPPAIRPGSFKVKVDVDGMYQITYDALLSAGFPLNSVEPENLHLLEGGQEVAIQVNVGPDGAFTPGDRILFYGRADQSRYTNVNVYWLYSDETPGLRMGSRTVTPQDIYAQPSPRWITSRFAENHVYDPIYAEASGDHWYWAKLDRLQTECPAHTEVFRFGLPQLSYQNHTAKLRTSLQGYTWNTHDIRVKVNGHDLGRIVWDNPVRKDSEFTFPSKWLKSTDNVLRLENGNCLVSSAPPKPNGVYFSHFAVEHQAGFHAIKDNEGKEYLDFWGEVGDRQYELQGFSPANLVLYDITDSTNPVALIGAQWTSGLFKFQDYAGQARHYLAVSDSLVRHVTVTQDTPSDLGLTSRRPDYLLIGYGAFLPATQPLVDLREAQGLDVMVVDVQDVYDEFSYGLDHPEAIKEYLHHVAAAWRPSPDYVLLVGDGTIDFRDHLGLGWHNFLPAFPADVDLHAGPVPAETASDRRLDPGAELPVFQMGRLPVSSVEQTQAVVTKIVSYENAPSRGFWNRRALIVSDNKDYAGDFTQFADELHEQVIEPLSAERLYLASSPTQPYEYSSTDPAALEAARAAILRSVSDGYLLVSYMGHSSHSQWAHEVLLHRDDVPFLQNGDPSYGGRLPVVLSMTCYTGAFQFPLYAPLDERLVLQPGGGAVAAWGTTGSAIAAGHRHLAQGFLAALQEPGPVTLGAAVYAGLLNLHIRSPANHELIDTYVLLGDPAMRLNRFEGAVDNVYLPLARKGW